MQENTRISLRSSGLRLLRCCLAVAGVLAMQVWKQEYQWKRQRSDHRGNPRPYREAPSATFGNPTGEIHRTDCSDRQQCEEHIGVEANVGTHRASSSPALRRA